MSRDLFILPNRKLRKRSLTPIVNVHMPSILLSRREYNCPHRRGRSTLATFNENNKLTKLTIFYPVNWLTVTLLTVQSRLAGLWTQGDSNS